MPWKNRCQITVLKKTYDPDLAEAYLSNPQVGPCTRFQEGQTFLVDKDNYLTMLDGQFCAEAWQAIQHYVYAALQGGDPMHGWSMDDRGMINCCNDGVRPVIFKIQRLEE